MHYLKAEWKAYPMDRKGIKTCQRGEVSVLSPYRLVNVNEVLEVVRRKVYLQYPELKSCPIQLSSFDVIEQREAK